MIFDFKPKERSAEELARAALARTPRRRLHKSAAHRTAVRALRAVAIVAYLVGGWFIGRAWFVRGPAPEGFVYMFGTPEGDRFAGGVLGVVVALVLPFVIGTIWEITGIEK